MLGIVLHTLNLKSHRINTEISKNRAKNHDPWLVFQATISFYSSNFGGCHWSEKNDWPQRFKSLMISSPKDGRKIVNLTTEILGFIIQIRLGKPNYSTSLVNGLPEPIGQRVNLLSTTLNSNWSMPTHVSWSVNGQRLICQWSATDNWHMRACRGTWERTSGAWPHVWLTSNTWRHERHRLGPWRHVGSCFGMWQSVRYCFQFF